MVVNGWKLYLYRAFDTQLKELEDEVEVIAAKSSGEEGVHRKAKLLAAIRHLIFVAIPRNPNLAEFRQGNTLGKEYRHWFRAKFHQRYRLFYRFSSEKKIIVYVWMNDEGTLRKAGSKTDPYQVFRAKLETGNPPASIEELIRQSREI
jgi:toxin YhaV